MNRLLRASYAAAGQAARLATALAPAGSDHKLLRSLAARRGLLERYAAWAASGRDPSRPLVWLHAPSMGEGLQARPVLDWLRVNHPDLQIAWTFFSPSAASLATTVQADFADYLPFDRAAEVGRALDLLRPSALVFSKADVWPELCREATRRGVPLGVVSATMPPGSSRLRGLARGFLGDAYASLRRVGAVASEDALLLQSLGVRVEALRITGDTRYDQVAARALRAGGTEVVQAMRSPRPTLVAGSTWPADEAALLPAWRELRRLRPDARLIIAPHEPRASHLAPIERWAREAHLSLSRLDAPGARSADVVLVDRVGVLGDLYAVATAAFVGGGFHAAGLHSVLEPAAFGVPVLFGPRHHAARDAALLLERGGARTVSSGDLLRHALDSWLYEPARLTAGAAARAHVQAGLGATRRSGELVEDLLRERPR